MKLKSILLIGLLMLSALPAFSQFLDLSISVERINDSCSYGKQIIFRDINQDSSFDNVRRSFCNFSFKDDSLIIVGKGKIESGMKGLLISGSFENKDFNIKLIDPFKNVVHGYLRYDQTLSMIILDFNTSISESYINKSLSVFPNPFIVSVNQELIVKINFNPNVLKEVNIYDLYKCSTKLNYVIENNDLIITGINKLNYSSGIYFLQLVFKESKAVFVPFILLNH